MDAYGAPTAADILTLIRMITIGNLLGNTFDAFLSRLQGQPNPASTLVDEVAVLGGTALGTLPLAALMGLRMLAGRLRPAASGDHPLLEEIAFDRPGVNVRLAEDAALDLQVQVVHVVVVDQGAVPHGARIQMGAVN